MLASCIHAVVKVLSGLDCIELYCSTYVYVDPGISYAEIGGILLWFLFNRIGLETRKGYTLSFVGKNRSIMYISQQIYRGSSIMNPCSIFI